MNPANPVTGPHEATSSQAIFAGKITNWAEVGGPDRADRPREPRRGVGHARGVQEDRHGRRAVRPRGRGASRAPARCATWSAAPGCHRLHLAGIRAPKFTDARGQGAVRSTVSRRPRRPIGSRRVPDRPHAALLHQGRADRSGQGVHRLRAVVRRFRRRVVVDAGFLPITPRRGVEVTDRERQRRVSDEQLAASARLSAHRTSRSGRSPPLLRVRMRRGGRRRAHLPVRRRGGRWPSSPRSASGSSSAAWVWAPSDGQLRHPAAAHRLAHRHGRRARCWVRRWRSARRSSCRRSRRRGSAHRAPGGRAARGHPLGRLRLLRPRDAAADHRRRERRARASARSPRGSSSRS